MSKHAWDFDSDTTPEALAAWEAYEALPINSDWAGMERPGWSEQDAFTAGFDTARSTANPLVTVADAIAVELHTLNQILRDGQRAKRTVGL